MTTRGFTVLATVMVSVFITNVAGANALVKRTAESEVQPNGFSVALAECQADERVVSGGYRLPPGDSDTPITSRAKGNRAWTVVAQESGFTAFALCSKQIKPREVAETVGFKNPDNGRGTPATAKCGRDERVISGGFQFSEPIDNSPVFRSRPTDGRSWSVLALSELGDSDLKVLAYCVDDLSGVAVRKESVQVPSDEIKTVEAKCKSAETRLSGGWTVSPRPDWNNADGPDTFFSEAFPTAKEGFQTTAINFSAVAGRISSIAVCMR
jgi:hypothetical protein